MSALPAIRIDAQALIAQAIERGTDPSTIERFVALGERMVALQARQMWVTSMTQAQKEFPVIEKTAEGKTSNYTYNYAPLDEIDAKIKPVLHAHELVMTWQYDSSRPGEVGANCRITHALGHFEDSGFFFVPVEPPRTDGKGATPAQRAGIAATYARRYSCQAVGGIVPHGEDPDGKTDDDTPAATAARADGSVLVTDVKEFSGNKKTGGRWVKWAISFDDGSVGDTWDAAMADQARKAQADGELLVAIMEKKGQYTNLVSLTPPEAPGGPVGDALDGFDADIAGGAAPGDLLILISDGQQKKLRAVVRGSGWGPTEQEQETALHDLLTARQIAHVKDIPVAAYDEILNAAKAGPKK